MQKTFPSVLGYGSMYVMKVEINTSDIGNVSFEKFEKLFCELIEIYALRLRDTMIWLIVYIDQFAIISWIIRMNIEDP